jgi:hypothetical protein
MLGIFPSSCLLSASCSSKHKHAKAISRSLQVGEADADGGGICFLGFGVVAFLNLASYSYSPYIVAMQVANPGVRRTTAATSTFSWGLWQKFWLAVARGESQCDRAFSTAK